MIDYLYQTSDFNLFLLLTIPLVLFSFLALLFIRYFVPIHLRYQENAVIGFTSALITVIYGVLAGFATLYLINNNNAAIDSVQREASAIRNLYRDSEGLSVTIRPNLQANIRHYLSQVVTVEWQLMSTGRTVTDDGDLIIDKITDLISNYKSSSVTESLIVADMLSLTDKLYTARQDRIQMSYSSLSNEVWIVIIVGSILTLCVCYLFGVNFYLHVFVTVATALMTASIIFLLISLDKPFQGQFIVGPDALRTASTYINK